MTTSINLNQYATVRLTKRGREVLDTYNQQFPRKVWLQVPESGVMREQIWQLMQIFGAHMALGFDSLFEGCCMEVDPQL